VRQHPHRPARTVPRLLLDPLAHRVTTLERTIAELARTNAALRTQLAQVEGRTRELEHDTLESTR